MNNDDDPLEEKADRPMVICNSTQRRRGRRERGNFVFQENNEEINIEIEEEIGIEIEEKINCELGNLEYELRKSINLW